MPRRLCILVADDERDTVLTLVELLREAGHDAHSAYRGDEVLARVKALEPDAVLLDIALPGKSGWDIARSIRQTHGNKVVLIAISGLYTLAADQILGKIVGFDYYLAKPYDPAVLLKLLQGT